MATATKTSFFNHALPTGLLIMIMKTVYVIHEKQLGSQSVIGVVDTVEKADKMMKEYYGNFEVLEYKDIRDSGLEWEKKIRVEESKGNFYFIDVWVEWFTINEI